MLSGLSWNAPSAVFEAAGVVARSQSTAFSAWFASAQSHVPIGEVPAKAPAQFSTKEWRAETVQFQVLRVSGCGLCILSGFGTPLDKASSTASHKSSRIWRKLWPANCRVCAKCSPAITSYIVTPADQRSAEALGASPRNTSGDWYRRDPPGRGFVMRLHAPRSARRN